MRYKICIMGGTYFSLNVGIYLQPYCQALPSSLSSFCSNSFLSSLENRVILICRYYNGSTYNYEELWQGIRSSDCFWPCTSTKVSRTQIMFTVYRDLLTPLNIDFCKILEYIQCSKYKSFINGIGHWSEGGYDRVLHSSLFPRYILRWPWRIPRPLAGNRSCPDSGRCSAALCLDNVK